MKPILRIVGLFFLIVISLCIDHPEISAQCNLTIDVPSDMTICSPQQVDLIGNITGNYVFFEWIGSNGFSDVQLITDDFSDQNTTYTLTAFGQTSTNLVVNGDFSAGNTAFDTDYLLADQFCPPNPFGVLGCEAMYSINTNAANTHTNFSPCNDHTSGTGNMMIVNGSPIAENIWCQDVSVIPNTNYLFSAWATSVNPSSPAILQFSINGNLIGSNFTLTSTTCSWQNFTEVWSSESSNSATICITNQNFSLSGNDFAIDDIEFVELCEEEASFDVVISEVTGSLPTSNPLNCNNPLVDLTISPSDPSYSYQWEALFGGIISGSTTESTAVGVSSGLYSVTITDNNGCTKKLTTSINGSTIPPVANVLGDFALSCSTNQVTVFSSNTEGGNTYFWQGSADASTIGFAVYDTPGIYYLEITNSFDCTTVVPFQIENNTITPNYDLPAPEVLSCIGDSTEIIFTSTTMPDQINWFDPFGNPLGQSDTLVVNDIGFYLIELEYSDGCIFYDSILVSSQASSLSYFLGESPIISCSNTLDSITISISTPYDQIIWFQDTILGNGENLPINHPGLYQVDIIDQNGCITRDSVSVLGDYELNPYLLGSEDIDCIDGQGYVSIVSDSLISVTWTLPNGVQANSDTVNSTSPGTFYLEIIHDNGCSEVDSIELLANQNFPNITVDFDSISCAALSAIIDVSSSIEDTDFEWVGPNGFLSNASNITVDQAGYYIFTATTQDGCTSKDSVLISADLAQPNFSLIGDTINCNFPEADIDLTGDVDLTILEVEGAGLVEVGNNNIIVDAPGQYTVIVEATNGCTSEQSIEIISDFSTPDQVGLDPIELDCFTPDSLLTLLLPSDVESYWVEGIDTIWNNSIALNSNSTAIELHLINPSTGCMTVEELLILQDFTVYPFDIVSTNISCENPDASIFIDVAAPYAEIIAPAGMTLETETEFSTNSLLTGDITIIFDNGCQNSQAFEIGVDTISPSISAEDRGFSCIKEPLALVVEVDITNALYSWTGPLGITSNEDFLITAIPGLYQVTITDPSNGCSSSTEVQVFEFDNNLTFDLELDQPLCFGESGSIYISGLSGWTQPYEVYIVDEQNEVVASNNILPGDYTVIIEDDAGCDSSIMVNIVAPILIDLQLVSELTISPGTELQLDAFTNLNMQDIASISWSPSSYLSCDDCLTPFVVGLTEDTEFSITIVDNNGCTVTESILIRVVIDYSIYNPNIFTPDGNGINDVFYLQSNNFAAESTIADFAIFDRWGNKVFQKFNILPNNPSEGWDGSFNNSPAKSGVYAWYARVVFPDNTEQILQGDLTLRR